MKRVFFYQIMLVAVAVSMLAVWGCESDETVGGLSQSGRIGVYPKPSFEEFPWTISGPNGYSLADTGSTILEDMVPGSYTVTWGELNGWVSPTINPVQSQLSAGSFMTFTTTFAEIGGSVEAGQVVVSVNPAELLAPWIITGPDNFNQSGVGTQTFSDLVPGTYTVTWGEIDGFNQPDPEIASQVMIEGQGLTFNGVYQNRAASEFTFVEITPGTFLMGGADEFRMANELPQHQVTLTQAFEMSASEVTWAQYTRIMGGENPSQGGCPVGFNCTNLAVDSVEWLDAVEFCNRASISAGLTPAYTIVGTTVTWDIDADGYRLPTEAEWEFACRAGTQTSYSSGPGIFDNFSCYNDTNLTKVGWYCKTSAWPPDEMVDNRNPRIPRVHTVMALEANNFGLFDMHGNVWEWVWDVSEPYEALPMFDVAFYTSPTDSIKDGNAMISIFDTFGVANLMRFTNISQRMVVSELGLSTQAVSFQFADFDTLANIRINNETLHIGDLRNAGDFPTAIATGVTYAIMHETVSDELLGDGFTGTITLTGDVRQMVIGGSTLLVDEILVSDGDASIYGHDLRIDFALSTLGQIFFPDSFGRANYFGCTVTDPRGRISGTTHMLRGGSFLSTPRNCRSAARSQANKGRFAGFRIVRNLP